MGRALRPDTRYAATDLPIHRGRASGEERTGDHGACGRVRPPGAVGVNEGISGSCRVIMGRALRPDTRYAATDLPIHRGRASGEERTGDHGACGRVRPPGAVGVNEGVSGSCRVIMGRALRAARPSRATDSPVDRRADGVGPGSAVGRGAREGATGYEVIMGRALRAGYPLRGNGSLESTGAVRQGERPGDHGVCGRSGAPRTDRCDRGVMRRVRGDHGACAQGGMPVTRQRIPRIDERRAAAEHGR